MLQINRIFCLLEISWIAEVFWEENYIFLNWLTTSSTKYYTTKISHWKMFYRENVNKNVDVVQIVISTVNCNSFYFKMETRERRSDNWQSTMLFAALSKALQHLLHRGAKSSFSHQSDCCLFYTIVDGTHCSNSIPQCQCLK